MKVQLGGNLTRPQHFIPQYRRHIPVMAGCARMAANNNLTPEEIRFIIETSPNPEYTYNLLMSGGFWDVVKKVGTTVASPFTSIVKTVTGAVAPAAVPIVSTAMNPVGSIVGKVTATVIQKAAAAKAAREAAAAAKANAEKQARLRREAEAAGLAQAAALKKRDQAIAEAEANAAAAKAAKAQTEAIVAERQLATVSQPAEESGGIAKFLPFAALAAIPLFMSGK